MKSAAIKFFFLHANIFLSTFTFPKNMPKNSQDADQASTVEIYLELSNSATRLKAIASG